MEEIATRIKGYVLVLFPTILADLEISDAQLDFLVQDVIDRALTYMNRDQLVYQYGLDLVRYPNTNEVYNRYWADYDYPIPPRIERVLAKTVVGVAKNVISSNTASTGAITSLEDNGQKVTYSDKITNFLSSSSDAEVFSGTLEMLKGYILPTVVKDEYTAIL